MFILFLKLRSLLREGNFLWLESGNLSFKDLKKCCWNVYEEMFFDVRKRFWESIFEKKSIDLKKIYKNIKKIFDF